MSICYLSFMLKNNNWNLMLQKTLLNHFTNAIYMSLTELHWILLSRSTKPDPKAVLQEIIVTKGLQNCLVTLNNVCNRSWFQKRFYYKNCTHFRNTLITSFLFGKQCLISFLVLQFTYYENAGNFVMLKHCCLVATLMPNNMHRYKMVTRH